MEVKVGSRVSGTVRAVLEGEKRVLEGLAAPFGSLDNINKFSLNK